MRPPVLNPTSGHSKMENTNKRGFSNFICLQEDERLNSAKYLKFLYLSTA